MKFTIELNGFPPNQRKEIIFRRNINLYCKAKKEFKTGFLIGRNEIKETKGANGSKTKRTIREEKGDRSYRSEYKKVLT